MIKKLFVAGLICFATTSLYAQRFTFDLNDKNQEKAINKWREIFGNKFPTYE